MIEALLELTELRVDTLCLTFRDHLALPEGVDHRRLPFALPEQVRAQEPVEKFARIDPERPEPSGRHVPRNRRAPDEELLGELGRGFR